MISKEIEQFEVFLADSFNEGTISRELRLSNKEIQFLKTKYPGVIFNKLVTQEYSDAKAWYEVKFQSL